MLFLSTISMFIMISISTCTCSSLIIGEFEEAHLERSHQSVPRDSSVRTQRSGSDACDLLPRWRAMVQLQLPCNGVSVDLARGSACGELEAVPFTIELTYEYSLTDIPMLCDLEPQCLGDTCSCTTIHAKPRYDKKLPYQLYILMDDQVSTALSSLSTAA